MQPLSRLTSIVLDPENRASMLRPEILQITKILWESHNVPLRNGEEDIASGETQTDQGLALSPTMAAMCADDYMRTIQFLRGTHEAIVELRKEISDRPIRVLYAGCGPYATLAIPLLSIFSADEVQFALLDLHPESIASATSITEVLGFGSAIARVEVVDAGAYRVSPETPPDILLLEMMQACLEAEPQVSVARHLLAQAPKAVIVPEEVRIDLKLIDPSSEFDLEGAGAPVQRKRIHLGTVFTLNRETASSWADIRDECLPAAELTIPDSFEAHLQPMLFTEIRVHGKHVLDEYASGLTCPRALIVDGAFRPGAQIRFRYELGSAPGLRAEIFGSWDGS